MTIPSLLEPELELDECDLAIEVLVQSRTWLKACFEAIKFCLFGNVLYHYNNIPLNYEQSARGGQCVKKLRI